MPEIDESYSNSSSKLLHRGDHEDGGTLPSYTIVHSEFCDNHIVIRTQEVKAIGSLLTKPIAKVHAIVYRLA